MKIASLAFAIILAGSVLFTTSAAAQTPTTAEQEAAYTKAIEGRTTEILKLLGIADTNRTARVHDVILGQYRSLRAWHDAHDTKLKELNKQAAEKDANRVASAKTQIAGIEDSLKTLHVQFLAKLAADLSPAQVEQVKDKMTYNKVQVTYDGYCDMLPTLTASQKAKILEWLKEAREIAMDCGSAEEKTAVFGKYKGRINNYLSKEGYDLKKSSADWNARLKANSAKKGQ